MFGGGSIQLMRLFGIRIGASPSWFLVLFLFIYIGANYFRDVLGGSITQAYVVSVIAVFLFFLSLILHELGHALVARRLGIGISGIELWLFGGLAKMSRAPDSPGAEFKVSSAGPAMTLLAALVFLGLSALVEHGAALDVARFADDAEVSPTIALLGTLASINFVLFVFNIVPAFPLDGGHILRAAIWKVSGDRHKATRIAGRIGEGFAYLLVALGLLLAVSGSTFNGLWLAFVGFFMAQSARAAVASTAFTERIDGITVADVMDSEPVAMPATTTMTQAQEEYFLRYRWDWFSVVDEHGRFLGVVREPHVAAELTAGRPVLEVGEIVERDDAEGWRVRADSPLEELLGHVELQERGALMAVDGDGVLLGVVTAEQVRRALTAAMPQRVS